MDALVNICSDKNYNIYDYPPPDMRKGCEAFMGAWNEVVERELLKRDGNDKVETDICIHKTKACVGIDSTKP